jgi:hypothetical protein
MPTLAEMDAVWLATVGADTVGPFVANALGTEQLRVRCLCPIPQHYVSLLCLAQNFTLRRFWTDVIGQIRQDGLVADCVILVDWARVASTLGPVNANGDPTVPLVIDKLRVPLTDD